jgi:hypothetical protein
MPCGDLTNRVEAARRRLLAASCPDGSREAEIQVARPLFSPASPRHIGAFCDPKRGPVIIRQNPERPRRSWSSAAARPSRPPTATTPTAIGPSRNVSGTAVSDRDPPICEFFQRTKAIRQGGLPAPAEPPAIPPRPSDGGARSRSL